MMKIPEISVLAEIAAVSAMIRSDDDTIYTLSEKVGLECSGQVDDYPFYYCQKPYMDHL